MALYMGNLQLDPGPTLCRLIYHASGQITISPKPELRAFGEDSISKLPFGVTSAEVAIICLE